VYDLLYSGFKVRGFSVEEFRYAQSQLPNLGYIFGVSVDCWSGLKKEIYSHV
jgi:hypothetical protein